MKKILQLGLWMDCYDRCSFCSLNDTIKFISKEEKINRIHRAIEISQKYRDRYSILGLTGGDFFQGELQGVEQEWIHLMESLNRLKYQSIWINSKLTCKNIDLLLDSLNALKDSFPMICTSYDAVGRFTEDSLFTWKNNVDFLIKNGYRVNVTMIPTQDLLDQYKKGCLILPKGCTFNLCEPYISKCWYENNTGKDYHCRLLLENEKRKIFNLPKRKDFIDFILNNEEISRNYINYNLTHSADVIEIGSDNDFWTNRTNKENSRYLDTCGHPYFSHCYCDSDKCAMCDAENIFK